MGKNNNVWPPPVKGLEYEFEGPSADHLIDTSHIYDQTVYQDVHAQKNEWTVMDKSQVEDYLPYRTKDVKVTVGIHENKTTIDLPTFGSIPLANHFQYKRGFVINVGGSIWGLDFVPKSPPPPEDDKTHYLAVGGYKGTTEEHFELGSNQPRGSYKNAIQIWRMALSVKESCEDPVLDLCLLHDYGITYDLRWCPYGTYEDGDIGEDENKLPKLGILSFISGDGAVRTIVVPHPKAVRKVLSPNTDENETIYLRIDRSRCAFAITTSQVTSIAWGGHSKLATGHAVGNLAVWDMEAALRNTSDNNDMPRNRHLIFSCIPFDASVRSISWNGHDNPDKLVAGGYDGRLVMIDINDPFIGLTLNRSRSIVNNCAWAWHGTMVIHSDADNLTQGFGINTDGTPAKLRFGEMLGFCWTAAVSEHHAQFAVASSLGWVRSCNMYQKKIRQLLLAQNTVYKLHYHEDKDIYQYIDGIAKQTIDETRSLPSYRQFGETHMQIQRVVWNPNKTTSAFLASGGAAGLCRIDFEGRGSKWE
ncbi:MAG: hypothetical protein EXX96DRAFT_548476 [Benjaminiella poitrasii]|nr:MAG: hypothetical protein EXX96DRAFT_548476 [Benjaminiella poitrasii]